MKHTEEKDNTAKQNKGSQEENLDQNDHESIDEQVITDGKVYDEFENLSLSDLQATATSGALEDADDIETDLSSEQKMGRQVEKLTKELTESNDKYLRMVAEFDNFRKRTSKERMDLFKTAGKDILVSIIPVMDDFERAEKALAKTTDVQSVKDGLAIVAGKLKSILVQQGLKEMKTIGETFDTDLHEAITKIPAPSLNMKGKVIDEVEKGYLLNDKVIRFAKVIIGE